MLAFEKLEACRWIEYLRLGGLVVVVDHTQEPLSVTAGTSTYPSDERVHEILSSRTASVHIFDGLALARQAGNVKATNVVAMGFLSAFLEIPLESWLEGLRRSVPPRFLELNTRAFQIGRDDGERALQDVPKRITK
jgi:indolepyruvate ferredoxin oxidoreductase, beta subunit